MTLDEHRAALARYEQLLNELIWLRDLQTVRPDRWLLAADGGRQMPVPLAYAESWLREHILALEAKAADLSRALGIEA